MKRIILTKVNKDINTSSFWKQQLESRKDSPILPLLPKPCEDCAVVGNLYKEFSQSLQLESKEVQLKVSQTWDCHNCTNFACKGNADYLNISW